MDSELKKVSPPYFGHHNHKKSQPGPVDIVHSVAIAIFDRHCDGRVRVVMDGEAVNTRGGWKTEKRMYSEWEVNEALEDVHKGMSLSLWTVYENPTDRPGEFIARRWLASPVRQEATSDIFAGPTLDAVRAQFPRGLVNIGRMDGDEAQIVEVWI